MLKIPIFILGGLLILTGFVGYLFQASSLSIVINGPLADDAKLTLSDGTQTHVIELGFPSGKESAGDQAKEIITRFYGEGDGIMGMPPGPATKASQNNNVIKQMDKDPEGIESFWYASSTKATLESLIQDNENYLNAGDPDYKKTPVAWDEVDANSSTIKFVYVNAAGNSGPSTLKVSNWKNIDYENPPENNTLEFGKSLTAFIPSAIGLLLILLVVAGEIKPSARKHIMHFTVLFGLFAFYMVVKRIGPAVAEMSWLRGEPNGIIEASSLKSTALLVSAGLLLIFVILCVVSFIQARKEMAAQAKKDKLAKKNASQSKPKDKEEDSKNEEKRKQDGKNNAKDKSDPKSSDKKASPNKPKSGDDKSGSDKKTSGSPPKDMPRKKETGSEKESSDAQKKDFSSTKNAPEDKKSEEEKKEENAPENKPGKEKAGGADSSGGKPDESKSDDPGEQKDSDAKPAGERPSPVKKESQEALEKKEDSPSEEPKKDDGKTKDSPNEGTEEK